MKQPAPQRTEKDALRAELDKKMLELVRQASVPTTRLADRIAALKVASGWWGISRKGQKPEEPPTAWDGYRKQLGEREAHREAENGEADDA